MLDHVNRVNARTTSARPRRRRCHLPTGAVRSRFPTIPAITMVAALALGGCGQTRKTESPPEQTEPARLDPQVVAKLNAATVRVQVQYRNRESAYFSGFFEKDSGLVVTTARAVGLKEPADSPWQIINVITHDDRGEYDGRLLGRVEPADVDPENDLALIHTKAVDPKRDPLDGLVVRGQPLGGVKQVFVIGVPSEPRVGSTISVHPTTIASSQSADDREPRLIRVTRAATRGHSGGPVVDGGGNVIGVALAGPDDPTIESVAPAAKVVELLARRRK